MALLLGVLSILFGSLFISLTVNELGSIGNSFLTIYGMGLIVLGGLALNLRKRKAVNIKLQGISIVTLGLILIVSSFFKEYIALVYMGSILIVFGMLLMLTKIEQLLLKVKPITICIYMIIFGIVMVITTFLGFPNEDLRSFGFLQLMTGIVFAVLDMVKEIKPTKQTSSKAK